MRGPPHPSARQTAHRRFSPPRRPSPAGHGAPSGSRRAPECGPARASGIWCHPLPEGFAGGWTLVARRAPGSLFTAYCAGQGTTARSDATSRVRIHNRSAPWFRPAGPISPAPFVPFTLRGVYRYGSINLGSARGRKDLGRGWGTFVGSPTRPIFSSGGLKTDGSRMGCVSSPW